MINKESLDPIFSGIVDAKVSSDVANGLVIYSVGSEQEAIKFAILELNRQPLRLSLRMDPLISKNLREQYDTAMSGVNLNPSKWTSIVLTGQIELGDIKDLIVHAYTVAQSELEV